MSAGTFTDAVLLADGELGSAKLSTQPRLLAAVLDYREKETGSDADSAR